MTILWITNIIFPEAEVLLKGSGELKSSGGWMLGAANALLQNEEMHLHVATVCRDVSDLRVLQGERITYYLIPFGKGNTKPNPAYEPYCLQIRDMVKPDVVHIHGTEFSQGLAYVNACGAENVVVSIQGMKSAYYYYYYGLTKTEVLRNITLRDMIRGTLFDGKRAFQQAGEYEKELLSKVHHIIGRTSWDRARTWAINPEAEYHFCNETLRPEFYDGARWEYEKCQKHSIFLSQAGYPIKGLHMLLRAMPLILRHYPDTIIRIAGRDITHPQKRFGLPMLTGYGKIIKKMICQYGVQDQVQFVGNMNAADMKQEYLRANVFVCPSSIENSPNSLGEAQIVGVPCVASYAGGIPDMMRGDEEHLYRFEEVEMLAYVICDCFAHSSHYTVNPLQNKASDRHSPDENAKQLQHIYASILNKTKSYGSGKNL